MKKQKEPACGTRNTPINQSTQPGPRPTANKTQEQTAKDEDRECERARESKDEWSHDCRRADEWRELARDRSDDKRAELERVIDAERAEEEVWEQDCLPDG